jgi:predicted protein tyrosine phosphatase
MDSATPPFGITVCGLGELDGHSATGASHVLSILDPDHPVPEAFGAFGEHEKLELRFHDIIEDKPGHIAPQPEHVDAILALGRSLQSEPGTTRHLLVHCHAGISRSTAAMALILAQAMPEQSAEQIIRMVHGIREKAWPNLRMIEFGDAKLGRGGALVTATHALHRLQLDRRPRVGLLMETDGRGREVAAARQHAPLANPAWDQITSTSVSP